MNKIFKKAVQIAVLANPIRFTICVNCGKVIDKFKGSQMHPYCKECYKNIFEDNDIKYMADFQEKHKYMQ